jgi:periplasmic protein TonB
MNSPMIDQLDQSVTALLAGRQPAPATGDLQMQGFLDVAAELRFLPRPDFRACLRSDLLYQAALAEAKRRRVDPVTSVPGSMPAKRRSRENIVPPLFSTGSGAFPVRASHLAVSFAVHVAALSLVVASGWWMVENRAKVRSTVAQLVPGEQVYLLHAAPGEAQGGGGGGDLDTLKASHGVAPRFANEQVTSPAAVVRNESPKLAAELTVIGPPALIWSQSDKIGDPAAAILAPPSNGTGSGGWVGAGHGGGIGIGDGPGVGDGRGGGIGGGIYHVGGGVSAPHPIYDPDPEYSEDARKSKYQGSVMLSVIIGPDGRPRNVQVARSVGMGLDEKAVEAVSRWRFAPAMKDGQPVAVQVNIEVAFRLY